MIYNYRWGAYLVRLVLAAIAMTMVMLCGFGIAYCAQEGSWWALVCIVGLWIAFTTLDVIVTRWDKLMDVFLDKGQPLPPSESELVYLRGECARWQESNWNKIHRIRQLSHDLTFWQGKHAMLRHENNVLRRKLKRQGEKEGVTHGS